MSEKPEISHSESQKSPGFVTALPDNLRRDGGLLLDAEGLEKQDEQVSLKFASDGHTVLLPQPTDNTYDPLNWSWARKHLVLFTVAWAALTADVTAAAGSAIIFPQAEQWHITPGRANDPNAIAVLLNSDYPAKHAYTSDSGIGGLIWVPVSSIWGRGPVLFWTTVFGFGFQIGSACSTEYETYYAMRVVSALFLTSGQVISIAFLKDIFFFHERARKIGLWAVLYIASPYLGPCLANFIIAATHHWPHVYWMCSGCAGIQLLLVLAFADETWYNRDVPDSQQPARPGGLGRLWRLTGVWGFRHHSAYFPSTVSVCKRFFSTITKPAFFLICLSYFLCFAWAIGINISTNLLLATPQEAGGYGLSTTTIGYVYFVNIGGVFIGEIFGHFFNDYMARRYIKRHNGIFESEVRLWTVYVSVALMIPALILIGQSLEKTLPLVAVIFGLGIFTTGVMINSVAVTAYALDSYPTVPAELSGWLNFARTVGGFAVGYFQQPWSERVGADASFGTQAAIVAVATIPVIVVHRYGAGIRQKYGPIG
ncbi:unnamed protein product [Clonostachys rosea]|uniref:Major facilitator superfamily (MFS) profile domain-containing protein n=1 Tax=Bionectria ochroleuca TaxID=29856 RepID=A0ABY6UAB9_BIOOC|nr:unnamed protein product [Clonostachys rosea]